MWAAKRRPLPSQRPKYVRRYVVVVAFVVIGTSKATLL